MTRAQYPQNSPPKKFLVISQDPFLNILQGRYVRYALKIHKLYITDRSQNLDIALF
jgi:hypothetical protein